MKMRHFNFNAESTIDRRFGYSQKSAQLDNGVGTIVPAACKPDYRCCQTGSNHWCCVPKGIPCISGLCPEGWHC